MKRYSIVFSSRSGNTKELAEAIRAVLPKEKCDYFGAQEAEGAISELLYIGFWTDRGSADENTLQFIKSLKNKKIFLFGTAGFGGSENYFKEILNRIKAKLDISNTVVGEYMCQGKMPQSVREGYMRMKNQEHSAISVEELIENFDRALSHPNQHDLEKLKDAIQHGY